MTNHRKEHDENDAPPLTRQALWSRARVAEGLCAICGREPRRSERLTCEGCGSKQADAAKRRYWERGKKSLERYHQTHPGAKRKPRQPRKES